MSQQLCNAGTLIIIALVVVFGIGVFSVFCAAMLSSQISRKEEQQMRGVRWSEEWEKERERRVKLN